MTELLFRVMVMDGIGYLECRLQQRPMSCLVLMNNWQTSPHGVSRQWDPLRFIHSHPRTSQITHGRFCSSVTHNNSRYLAFGFVCYGRIIILANDKPSIIYNTFTCKYQNFMRKRIYNHQRNSANGNYTRIGENQSLFTVT